MSKRSILAIRTVKRPFVTLSLRTFQGMRTLETVLERSEWASGRDLRIQTGFQAAGGQEDRVGCDAEGLAQRKQKTVRPVSNRLIPNVTLDKLLTLASGFLYEVWFALDYRSKLHWH